MSAAGTAYALVVFFCLAAGVLLIFVDGAMLWSVGLFLLGVVMLVVWIIWSISVWADDKLDGRL